MSAGPYVQSLEKLRTKELKTKLGELTGKTVKSNNRPYLIKQVAKALEEQAARDARAAKKKTGGARKKKRKRDPRLPEPGTVLERDQNGTTVRVKVLEEGFEFRGKQYRSLSAIAKEVSGGTPWNGYLYFGLTPYPKRRKASASGGAA